MKRLHLFIDILFHFGDCLFRNYKIYSRTLCSVWCERCLYYVMLNIDESDTQCPDMCPVCIYTQPEGGIKIELYSNPKDEVGSNNLKGSLRGTCIPKDLNPTELITSAQNIKESLDVTQLDNMIAVVAANRLINLLLGISMWLIFRILFIVKARINLITTCPDFHRCGGDYDRSWNPRKKSKSTWNNT